MNMVFTFGLLCYAFFCYGEDFDFCYENCYFVCLEVFPNL